MKAEVKRFNPEAEFFFDEGCYINELSNSEDDNAVSIAKATVPIGTKTKLHRLKGTDERYVILYGKGLMNLADNPPQEVSKGDVVYIPADCPQCIENTGDTNLVFLAICTPRFKLSVYEEIME